MSQPGHILMNGKLILRDIVIDLNEDKYSKCNTVYFTPFENIYSDMKSMTIVGNVNFKKNIKNAN